MKLLVLIIFIVAAVLLALGVAVSTLNFLLGVAPILVIVALVLLFLNRSGGRRIPE
jgi:hypothetical protein